MCYYALCFGLINEEEDFFLTVCIKQYIRNALPQSNLINLIVSPQPGSAKHISATCAT
jgi:hypothetical protein